MYNTKFVCTYNQCKEPFFSDTLYRKDLLYAFNIEDLDFEKHEKEINSEMFLLFDKMINHKKFLECINGSCSVFSSEDKFIGFAILMSYDFLHLTHPCICEFLENESISDDKINALFDVIKKYKL